MSERSRSEPNGTTYNLLFVCTGNTCRSPMAAAIARDAVTRRGWQHVEVRSAGVAAGSGAAASPQAVRAAAEHGLDLSQHASQQLSAELVSWADSILVMSAGHEAAVRELGGGEKVALVTEYAGRTSIDDPFGADDVAYARTYEQLEVAIDALLDRLAPIVAP